MWYDLSQLLSYNKILNFVIGQRGGGKSFNAKKWCVNDFIKNGKQFIWVRRYKTELKTINTWFDDLKGEGMFEGHKMEVKGRTAYINGEVAGYFIALSTSQHEKSRPFPNVNKIVYDEFVIDEGAIRYLPHEVETFLSFMDTVIRNRDDVRALLIANNVSVTNPYFDFFGVRGDSEKRFVVKDDLIIEFYKSEDFKNERLKTRFGQLIKNTTYGEFSLDNKSLKDNQTFVEPKSANAKFQYYLKYNEMCFGVWRDYEGGKIYISRKYDASGQGFSLTTNDHEPNLLFIKDFKNYPSVKIIKRAYSLGVLYYDDLTVKSHFYNILKLL